MGFDQDQRDLGVESGLNNNSNNLMTENNSLLEDPSERPLRDLVRDLLVRLENTDELKSEWNEKVSLPSTKILICISNSCFALIVDSKNRSNSKRFNRNEIQTPFPFHLFLIFQ
jgi:hypothetical protein